MRVPLTLRLLAPVLLAAGTVAQDNVLIILADDLGVDGINAYQEGWRPPSTPVIDGLAANGVLFRNAWANPVCSPSRACLLTGRYALRHGVGRNVGNLPGQPTLSLAETTLPRLLDMKGSGYAHAAIGKWHLTNTATGGPQGPNLVGFAHFAGISESGGGNYFSWPRTVNGTTSTSTNYATTQFVDDTLAWIQTTSEPWVCYLAMTAPHSPFHEPPASLHNRNLVGEDPGTNPVPFYKAMIEAMDTEIGRLLNTMDPGVRSRTNVIFMGDNGTPGEVTQTPFIASRAKATIYEGGINVPLIVSGPAVQSPGREEAALVSAVDLFATVAELCGIDDHVPFIKTDSVSFVPHLQNAGLPSVRPYVYSEYFPFPPGVLFTMRDANYKLIRNLAVNDQLYELAVDPFEQNNLLLGTLTAPEQAAYNAMLAELAIIRDQTGGFASFGNTACAGSNGNPTISGSGSPQINNSYTVHLSNGAPSQTAILLLGDSNSSWAGIPLPLPLAVIGSGPGCFIYSNSPVTVPVPTSGTGDASVTVPLPNASYLVTGSIYHSWLVVDPAAPSAGSLTASDGLEVIIGQ